jgi:5,10-methylenetetrahydrofolate reductase
MNRCDVDVMPRTKDLDFSLEITPPVSTRLAVLQRRASALGSLPRYVNVIHRTDRWSSLDASIALRQCGREPVWHVANRGRRAGALELEIDQAKAAGLSRVLCVRGEYKARDHLDTPKIREVVRMIRHRLPGAHVAVTLNHHQPVDRVMRNLLPKLEAGANAVQTQVTFELDALLPFAVKLKAERPDLEIRPMLMPVLCVASAHRLAQRLSISLPPELIEGLARGGAEAGWEHFSRLVASIDQNPLYSGLAVMTPMDMEKDFATRLARSIAAATIPVPG